MGRAGAQLRKRLLWEILTLQVLSVSAVWSSAGFQEKLKPSRCGLYTAQSANTTKQESTVVGSSPTRLTFSDSAEVSLWFHH